MPKRTFDGREFKWSAVGNSVCLKDAPENNRYTVESSNKAYWIVMFRGCCAPDAEENEKSLLGKYGHLERANAWTHLVPCIILLLFSFARPWLLGATSISDQLALASIIFSSITFAVSTVYHVHSTVPGMAASTRTLDHASIAISLACASIADLCMVTKDFQDVSFQAWLDPMLGALVLILYFGIRRLFVPKDETRQTAYDGEGCTLGLYRIFHSDLEHAALRAAGSASLTLSWVLFIPSAFIHLDTDPAVIWVVGAGIGTMLLVFGIILDNTGVVDDVLLQNKHVGPCSCNSKPLGCIFNTHALWHVIATAGAVSSIFAREYGIASWK
jgi:predicted membrane channel-forming protein YqfA (hemolysin III family)